MKNWVCKKCGGYIKFSVNSISIGTRVVFKLHKDGLNYSEFNFIHAVVLNIDSNFFYLVSYGDFYKVDKSLVYPENAPAKIIYNIFWSCYC